MALADIPLSERLEYACSLIIEQFIEQRNKLHVWRGLTYQPAQVDTGYIGQHLVSLVSGIEGGGFRGKGDDLFDGSEIKSANFLDSLDANGSVAPRWNFGCNDEAGMMSFLEYPNIYLVSIDLNEYNSPRFRIWKINPREHLILNTRYNEWIIQLGRPKLMDPRRPIVNFQLFPPNNKSTDTFARHGNGQANGFPKIQIELDNVVGSQKIFHAEIVNNQLNLIHPII